MERQREEERAEEIVEDRAEERAERDCEGRRGERSRSAVVQYYACRIVRPPTATLHWTLAG